MSNVKSATNCVCAKCNLSACTCNAGMSGGCQCAICECPKPCRCNGCTCCGAKSAK